MLTLVVCLILEHKYVVDFVQLMHLACVFYTRLRDVLMYEMVKQAAHTV